MTKRSPFFFLHIPKTAGTSFRLGLEQYYGKQKIVYDYGDKSHETHPSLRGVADHAARIKLLDQTLSNASADVIAGHVPWCHYQDLFSQQQVVVFLREPVQRVLSEYNHYVKHLNYEKGIVSFYRSRSFRNKQHYYTRGLNLEKVKFLGITEYYDESIRLFNDLMEADIPLLRVNTGNEGTRNDYPVSQELAEDIRRYNELDVAIYHAAISQFCSGHDVPKPDTVDISNIAITERGKESGGLFVGRVNDLDRNGEFFGWVLDQTSDEPLWIDIYINEIKVDTIQTGNYRGDLVKAGISKTGKAGFAYRLENLSEGDAISVRVSGTTFELNNSPLVVKDC